jgi:hypothetical protein
MLRHSLDHDHIATADLAIGTGGAGVDSPRDSGRVSNREFLGFHQWIKRFARMLKTPYNSGAITFE